LAEEPEEMTGKLQIQLTKEGDTQPNDKKMITKLN
jgi:hypothetical protein